MFNDFSKAFDSVHPEMMNTSILVFGISEKVASAIMMLQQNSMVRLF